ncbi:restriction endonuclease [Ruminococcus sp. AF18-29]|jgi:superfamily II DNA or RNA helicase|uniref:DEAD/DEAH box helicase family protein n=1 Tax=Ruminococcus bicirculans (ex Wegman et al. 2014) TaxID=1160721 RepID=UPI000E54FED5|nr:restriction endonuclease [Ruminococcus sp. AF18-29]
MQKPNINTSKNVTPMIYAYTTPEIARHNGWTKIGYTEQDVETRINQQTHTADVKWNLEWKGNALFDDGSAERFTDKDFHAYLRKSGIEQESGKNNEWFHITGQESKIKFYDFRANHGILKNLSTVIPHELRKEQEEAVERTIAYKNSHENGEFLWNAKPRFGKTLSVYDFCKKSGAKTVLIVTNRPAIANSWYEDYMKFLGTESGYHFVSEVDALKGKPCVLSRSEYLDLLIAHDRDDEDFGKCIEFVSLQDMKGSKYFSTNGIDKLREVADIEWDVLVIDEAHEGVDTYKTDVAFEHINRRFTLHLSGTPFKALANNKFDDNAIFNWTYADEQTAKRDWDVSSEEENPYSSLPKLNLFTYQMSEIIKEELQQGVEINGETEEYAFDLNEFFSTSNGKFKYDASVDKFLDAMTLQEKYPFSTPELREELKHTFWLLDRVDSAKALAEKLKNHPVFKDYYIILAAGDGKMDDADETKKSYDKVVEAIGQYDKTITLSVGQLTTGVTIPEWTAVLMLSNVKSPALYMQAAFRAQNTCLFKNGSSYARKENAYVFDFDPARTLTIFEEFANDLSADTSAGRGDIETRKKHITELLNFFPVIGEDENGELIELDAEKVLTIPRKIRSVEVVRRGFMSNFLFQNISQVFGAPQAVYDILSSLEPVSESKGKMNFSEEVKNDLSLNENGEVELPDEIVIGVTNDVFGDKIYAPTEDIDSVVSQIVSTPDKATSVLDKLKTNTHNQVTANILAKAKETYGSEMKPADKRKLESNINGAADNLINKSYTNFTIDKNTIEQQRTEALQSRHETGRSTSEINQEFDEKIASVTEQFQKTLIEGIGELVEKSKKTVVKTIETSKREREKTVIEDGIRDRLRGFSRTIPSFLMAYGDNTVTLATFDTVIPDGVFKEVTSITLDQFRFLRDGGSYTDPETGEEKTFNGQLFDPVVFDDSVKEFLALKKKLADYFDEKSVEDIFDYIPPQKTNQIFTPKTMVKKMVDMLEEENPGCFDLPDKTFIDLYMKSGLYVAEIVKRLYQSNELKHLYPDKYDRLKHIFEKQVYGLAPTEIIYKIATSYILGFDEDVKITKHNFKQVDALPYAKDGTLKEKLDEIYGDSNV